MKPSKIRHLKEPQECPKCGNKTKTLYYHGSCIRGVCKFCFKGFSVKATKEVL